MSKTAPKTTATLEAMFAIGSPARTKAFRTCSRCKGTGWWQFGRKCFKCGGAGKAERDTAAVQLRNKRAHVVEVREIIAGDTSALAGAKFGRRILEERIAQRTAQLAVLEAELAALEGAA